jgi:hypothetical protein
MVGLIFASIVTEENRKVVPIPQILKNISRVLLVRK